MIEHHGSCHCGNLQLVYRSAVPPEATQLRACQCGFCRKHGARALSDPEGSASITVADESGLLRYRFGLGLADYLVCRGCGVYLAAVEEDPEGARAVLVVHCLDDAEQFTMAATAVDFGGESVEARRARHRRNWTPAVMTIGEPR